uniref:Uncharacterized protein n=1 Tax=Oscillatoriales cyanobacterium SpSt-402 TaxID=2282168 RepID=A0A832H5N5_9CYAN
MAELEPTQTSVTLCEEALEAEVEEMWSFVGSNDQHQWLWQATDHQTFN